MTEDIWWCRKGNVRKLDINLKETGTIPIILLLTIARVPFDALSELTAFFSFIVRGPYMAKNDRAAFAGKRAFKSLFVEHVYADKPLKDYVTDRSQSRSTILPMMPVRASIHHKSMDLLRIIASNKEKILVYARLHATLTRRSDLQGNCRHFWRTEANKCGLFLLVDRECKSRDMFRNISGFNGYIFHASK